MTKIPYEIPAEIRDLTAKSVEDARKAFESFIEAAHKATAQAGQTILIERERIKRKTIANRRLLHRRQAA
jgi:hypothetical protein